MSYQQFTKRGEDRRAGTDRRRSQIDERVFTSAKLIIATAVVTLGFVIAIQTLLQH